MCLSQFKRMQIVLLVPVSVFIIFLVSSTVLDQWRLNEQLIKIEDETISRLRNRLLRVYNICGMGSRINSDHMLKNLVIDVKHNLTWCPVYKAASTTWMKIFAQLGNILNTGPHSVLENKNIDWSIAVREAYKLNPNINDTNAVINQTIRFVIVRHPFERLLSAYRDKLEHRAGREYYYQQYGMFIKRVYRQGFHFDNVEPSFIEFLTFLTKTQVPDPHWKPVAKQCAPCELQYDYIIKTETYFSDIYHMLKQLRINVELDVLMKENVNLRGATNIKLAKKYYSTIPLNLLRRVYKLYRDDFLLFDYYPDDYYAMTILNVSLS